MNGKRNATVVPMAPVVPAIEEDGRHYIAQLVNTRVKMRKSQAEVAAAMGITQGRLSRIESDADANISFGHFQAYARALGVESALMFWVKPA